MQRISTVTRKGQITVPFEVRQALGIEEGDLVAFLLEEGVLTVKPIGKLAHRPPIRPSEGPVRTAEELRELAADLIATSTIERMGGKPR